MCTERDRVMYRRAMKDLELRGSWAVGFGAEHAASSLPFERHACASRASPAGDVRSSGL